MGGDGRVGSQELAAQARGLGRRDFGSDPCRPLFLPHRRFPRSFAVRERGRLRRNRLCGHVRFAAAIRRRDERCAAPVAADVRKSLYARPGKPDRRRHRVRARHAHGALPPGHRLHPARRFHARAIAPPGGRNQSAGDRLPSRAMARGRYGRSAAARRRPCGARQSGGGLVRRRHARQGDRHARHRRRH